MKRLRGYLNSLDQFISRKTGMRIILGLIVLFNIAVYIGTEYQAIPPYLQSRQDASGFSHKYAHKFAYFHYYTGDFPLVTEQENLTYSKEAALGEIEDRGDMLLMEYKHWSRLGEHARIWAYLPNSWLKGSPEDPSIKLFNALVFTLSLCVLFYGFAQTKYRMTGLLLVALINITPFFIFEVYVNMNIFGLMGSVLFLCLGLLAPSLLGEKRSFSKMAILVLLAAWVVGVATEMRNEITVVFLSLLLMVLFIGKQKLWQKALLLVVVILGFWSSKEMVRTHFAKKWEQTEQLVAQQGGHIYTGDKIPGHKFWHPVFCGLGDFGEDKGYAWDDRVAYAYAVPVLNTDYDMNLKYTEGKYHLDEYYDEAQKYYIKFDEIDAYEEVMKNKVLGDIKANPGWYISILFKRIGRILTTTAPLPIIGWLIFPLAFILIQRKRWTELKLLIFSLPLSASALIIYSGKGITYSAVFVYFILGILFHFWFTRTSWRELDN